MDSPKQSKEQQGQGGAWGFLTMDITERIDRCKSAAPPAGLPWAFRGIAPLPCGSTSMSHDLIQLWRSTNPRSVIVPGIYHMVHGFGFALLDSLVAQLGHHHLALQCAILDAYARRGHGCGMVDVAGGANGGARWPLRSNEEEEDET